MRKLYPDEQLLVLFVGCIALLIVVVCCGLALSVRNERIYHANCEAAGGVVLDLRRDTLCLSRDGRVLGSRRQAHAREGMMLRDTPSTVQGE